MSRNSNLFKKGLLLASIAVGLIMAVFIIGPESFIFPLWVWSMLFGGLVVASLWAYSPEIRQFWHSLRTRKARTQEAERRDKAMEELKRGLTDRELGLPRPKSARVQAIEKFERDFTDRELKEMYSEPENDSGRGRDR